MLVIVLVIFVKMVEQSTLEYWLLLAITLDILNIMLVLFVTMLEQLNSY